MIESLSCILYNVFGAQRTQTHEHIPAVRAQIRKRNSPTAEKVSKELIEEFLGRS